jgi:hypothetical protein
MRGHLWLGALSLPLILFHSGFLFGHGLTSWLMWLFLIVWTSGLSGAYLQHALPRLMLRDVPMETIYEQIGHVREQLIDEADTIVADATGRLDVATAIPASASAKMGAAALATVMRPVAAGADDTGSLREFYVSEVRPFLEKPARSHPLAERGAAAASFAKLRPFVPGSLESVVQDLENLCEEERQLLEQERMHGILHGWLIVHVPLSFAMMALAIAHIVMALRY